MKKKCNQTRNNKLVFKSLFFTLFMFAAHITFAQVNIRGNVTDNTGETLIGVNVIIKENKRFQTVKDI